MAILKHVDFEVPGYGEVDAPPMTDAFTLRPGPLRPTGMRGITLRSVPVAMAGTSLSQSPDASFPDRGAVGLMANLSTGTDPASVGHTFDTEQALLYVRFMVAGGGTSGGEGTLLKGYDNGDTETFAVALDADVQSVELRLATSETLSGSLTGIDWHCVEVKVDSVGGVAELWVDGVSAGTVSGTFTTLGTKRLALGVMDKDPALVGEIYLDEWVMADAYIGPVVVTATHNHAADAKRWVVLYDGAVADSATWAESYRAARGVPYANLVALSGLSGHETVNAAEYISIQSQLSVYITNNNLDDVVGVLIGYLVPGVTAEPTLHALRPEGLRPGGFRPFPLRPEPGADGKPLSIASLLAVVGSPPPEAPDPTFYLPEVVDIDGLPDRSLLLDGRRYLTAEINAGSLADAQSLTSRADALVTTTCDGQALTTLDPATDRFASSASGWSDLAAWVGSLTQQQQRLTIDETFDGTAHGYAIEFTDATSGAFSVSGQAMALLATIGTSAGEEVRAGTGIIKSAIDAGYAYALGYVDTPSGGGSGGDLINPAALSAALRAGWTWAEALAVATPSLTSTWRPIGDPLGVLPTPLQGYEVYQRPTIVSAPHLVAVAPAGETQIDLSGFTPGSEQWVSVRSVSRCGVTDGEPVRARRMAFDDAGDLILPVPNAPVGLRLIQRAGGVVRALWAYVENDQRVAPAQFNVYVVTSSGGGSGGGSGGAFDFDSPDTQVTFLRRLSYTADLGPFVDGTLVRVIVRSESAAGAEEPNLIEACTHADAVAPDAPSAIHVGVTPE